MADVTVHLPVIDFAAGMVAIGVLIGWIGSSLAMRRFLRQK
jgi:cell division protein FtsX